MDRPFNFKVGGRVHFFPFKAEFYSTKKQYILFVNLELQWKKKFGFIRFVPSKQVFEHLLMAPSNIGKDIDKNQLDQGLS
jgi:hypothetical protein